MEKEEKEFKKKINIDKAKNKTTWIIIFSIISVGTYIFPLIVGVFDFGIVFEVISLVFVIIARRNMTRYELSKSKRNMIIAMIPIGWILIYDLIDLISYVSDMVDVAFLGYDYYYTEILLIASILTMFGAVMDLAKADNPEKYKESTDWFYESYEREKKGRG